MSLFSNAFRNFVRGVRIRIIPTLFLAWHAIRLTHECALFDRLECLWYGFQADGAAQGVNL